MTTCYGGNGQPDDGKPCLTEDDIARALLGPRGVPGQPDIAEMTPQPEKNFPKYSIQGHVESPTTGAIVMRGAPMISLR